jgi:transcriptional regulator
MYIPLSMYIPNAFQEDRVEVLHDLIRKHPFGTLVTLNQEGLQANHIPFELDTAPEPFGTLYAHVARANSVWRDLAHNDEALVILQGPNSYISPSWYRTRNETGMVVPTWNYAVVHAHGKLQAIEDPIWLRSFVDKLTRTHEQSLPEPWNVSDAPADYIEKQLSAIVGLKLTITRLTGKWKMSQNRPTPDRESVIQALRRQKAESAQAMAESIEDRLKG